MFVGKSVLERRDMFLNDRISIKDCLGRKMTERL